MLPLAGLLAAQPAQAQDHAINLRYGEHDENEQRAGVSLRLAPLWSSTWGSWRAALHPELELSRFRYTGGGPGAEKADQAGVIGMLRLVRGGGALRPYAEIGLGGALFSRDTLGEKHFSTRFQFSEHIGLGLELPAALSVGWQFSHYSNSDIELPNDGIDIHQIVVGVSF